jgi:hypothetical protein
MTTLLVALMARMAVLALLVSNASLALFAFAWAQATKNTAVFLFPALLSMQERKKLCQLLRATV